MANILLFEAQNDIIPVRNKINREPKNNRIADDGGVGSTDLLEFG